MPKLAENLQAQELQAMAQLATTFLDIKPLEAPKNSDALTSNQLTCQKLEFGGRPPIYLVYPQAITDQVKVFDKTHTPLLNWTINHPGAEFQSTDIDLNLTEEIQKMTITQYEGQGNTTNLNHSHNFFPFRTGIPVVSGQIINLEQRYKFAPEAIILVVGAQSFDKRSPGPGRSEHYVNQNTIAVYAKPLA